MNQQIEQIKKLSEPVFKRYKIRRAGVFGSTARGKSGPDSDIDILVDMDLSYDLFDFIKFKQELESSLKKKVDIVEYSAIKPVIRDNVLKSEIMIYESG
jgi:predicted nucleotidyltransferase